MYITPLNGTNLDECAISLVLLAPGEAQSWWDEIRPWLEKALETEQSGETPEDIKQLADSGDVQIWLVVTASTKTLAVGITKIQPYLHYRALELYQAAGTMLHRWKHALLVMEKFAKRNKCEWMFVDGRRGFVRLFAEYGYEEQYTRVGKRLTDGE